MLSAAGVVIAWIFSLWGSADIVNAFYQANHGGLMAGQLGATYFLPTFVVSTLRVESEARGDRVKRLIEIPLPAS
jgi:hypothetical protein